jgi:hypothetical protein
MLGRLISEIRRSLGKRSEQIRGSAIAAKTKTDPSGSLHALLRDPLAHPKSLNYETIAWIVAAVHSADYMVSRMMEARNLIERMELLDYALDQCSITGLVLEFGVYRGASLSVIARRAGQIVHGFDSFEGLPEDWTYSQKQGRFGLDGKLPVFAEANVQLHKGWFDATLPVFLECHSGPARFVHIDCDLYSSACTVLDRLAERIVPGTVILFDEYLNYPGWEQHEFRAFREFVDRTGRDYRYIGFASADSAVAVKII